MLSNLWYYRGNLLYSKSSAKAQEEKDRVEKPSIYTIQWREDRAQEPLKYTIYSLVMCTGSCQNSSSSKTTDGCKPQSRTKSTSEEKKMKNTSLLLLTVWAVSGAYISMLLTGVATFTNKWVFTQEVSTQDVPNGTLILTVSEHSGLIEACRISGKYFCSVLQSWTKLPQQNEHLTVNSTTPLCTMLMHDIVSFVT